MFFGTAWTSCKGFPDTIDILTLLNLKVIIPDNKVYLKIAISDKKTKNEQAQRGRARSKHG